MPHAPDHAPLAPTTRERLTFRMRDIVGDDHLITVERAVSPEHVGRWRAVEHQTCGALSSVEGSCYDSAHLAALRGAVDCGVEAAAVLGSAAPEVVPMPALRSRYKVRGTDEAWHVVGVGEYTIRIECGRQRRDVSPARLAADFELIEGPPGAAPGGD